MSGNILKHFIVIKKIGNGMFGTVDQIESNEKYYALKTEKIRENALEIQNIMSNKFSEWREIFFSTNFANKHQYQFIKLLEYDIIENCSYEYTEDYKNHLKYLPSHVVEKLKEKELSTHCIRKVYTLVDAPLKKIIKNVTNKKVYYSILTQLAYICYLLQTNGYTHNDMHTNNIGYIICDEFATIEIDSLHLNTMGYNIQLYDFGNVLHYSYDMTNEEKIQYKYNMKNEFLRPLSKFIYFKENEQMTKLIMWNDNFDFFENWIHGPNYELFSSPITVKKFNVKYKDGTNEIIENKSYDLSNTNKFSRFLAYQILFYDKFQKEYFADKYVTTYTPVHYISLDDYLYILNNIYNLQDVVYNMINKTNVFI